MLLSLTISGYAIIDKMDLTFSDGLNVLSGETGAGKSILVGALSIALGYRSSADAIRTGSDSMKVTAQFSVWDDKALDALLVENDIEKPDDALILYREVFRNGRNLCKINGCVVSVSTLRQISMHLVDIHGQHEHQRLLNNENHILILDEFGGARLESDQKQTKKAYTQYSQCRRRYATLIKTKQDYQANYDLYKRQYEELVEADLKVGEDEEIEKRLKVLKNREKLSLALDEAYTLLYASSSSISENLGEACTQLSYAVDVDESLFETKKAADDALILLQECTLGIREYRSALDFDADEFEALQERQNKINFLKKTYGFSIDEILQKQEKLQKSLENIENFDEDLKKAKKDYEQARENYIVAASALSQKRKEVGEDLCRQLIDELKLLNMGSVRFLLRFEEKPGSAYFSSQGIDDVVFLIATNAGQEPKQLSKIASGGEISRIMLAIKAILAQSDRVDTLIFDEIDTGISGRTAQVVACEMAKLARAHQLLVITHLPQIASMADAHYLVQKETNAQQTFTSFALLDEPGRVSELSRMMSGVELTAITAAHAKEMLDLAEQFKSSL